MPLLHVEFTTNQPRRHCLTRRGLPNARWWWKPLLTALLGVLLVPTLVPAQGAGAAEQPATFTSGVGKTHL